MPFQMPHWSAGERRPPDRIAHLQWGPNPRVRGANDDGAAGLSDPVVYDREIWAPTQDGLRRTLVASIDWIEASRDYVLLHTGSRRLILRATMNALERRLDPRQMRRIHRSTFVRPDAVTAFRRLGRGKVAVLLEGGVLRPVGPSYLAGLLAAIEDARAATAVPDRPDRGAGRFEP